MEKSVSNRKNDHYTVPNLEKGIVVLECLALHPEGLGLQKMKNLLDIPQTTIYRILNTLYRLGYLLYDEKAKEYKLSSKLLTLGFASLNEHNLLEIVLPYLREIRDIVKETVCFGVLGSEKGVFIEQAQGHHTFRFVLTPGKPFELHCSAPGKAIMAYLPVVIRDRYLSLMGFERFNERTITDREAYLKELDKVISMGYALDNEEELSGVICVGVPILNYKGFPCGSIWTSGPKDRLTPSVIAAYAQHLKKVSKEISERLGHRTL
ncbi:MAG: IclR family transcriptional regulator [Bacteroidales bacterium]|jgi:DNA-binding IclR family transcriptional regulator|nr:IclR family transcriptional regulator [Bacteroidales bacterium]